jgi:hypothetical protein
VPTAFTLFATGGVEAALTGVDEDSQQFSAQGISDGRQALVAEQADGADEVHRTDLGDMRRHESRRSTGRSIHIE